MKTDEEVVVEANALAAEFAEIDGYRAQAGHRFSDQANSREAKYWRMSCSAFEMLVQTSPDDALSGVEDTPTAPSISMQDVRLVAGEGPLKPDIVLSAVNAILRARAADTNVVRSHKPKGKK